MYIKAVIQMPEYKVINEKSHNRNLLWFFCIICIKQKLFFRFEDAAMFRFCIDRINFFKF